MSLPEEFKDKFNHICGLNFEAQAVWFLNGFWDELSAEGENIWQYIQKMVSLSDKKAAGSDLDEFQAHRFLESLGETLTVIELREQLRKIDINMDKKMALIEYLAFKHNKSAKQICQAAQSDNKEELARAQQLVEAAQASLMELQAKLEVQKAAAAAAKAADDENKAALAELRAQEEALESKKKELEALTQAGGVKGARAVQELAALKNEDPLPLRRAQINQEAAVRKSNKARKASEAAAAEAEAAAVEAQKKFDEAVAQLEEVKQMGGSSAGAVFIMERNLQEAKKYLPKSKQ